MLKKSIQTVDTDGNPTTVVAYFNLTKAECLELNIRTDIEAVKEGRNQNEIMDGFHRILSMSYGVKKGDGTFVKVNSEGSPLYYEFKSTEAYSELFMEIFQNPAYAAEFIKGILPAELVELSEGVSSQSDIPAHMANHPSMQGRRAKTPQQEAPAATRTPFQGEDAGPSVPTQTQEVQPDKVDPNYADYLAWRAQQDQAQLEHRTQQLVDGNVAHAAAEAQIQTPPDRVSPPEATQQDPSLGGVRDDLI